MDKLCKDCVNFIIENNKASCDLDLFENIDIYKAIIFIPEIHDCENFEPQSKFE